MDSQIQPLRIAKMTAPSSAGNTPMKMAKPPRPLSEIGPTSQRRNSPSYNQATKRMMVTQDTSPYTENVSPTRPAKTSLHEFWSSKEVAVPMRHEDNTPDRSPSPPPQPLKRRPSVERLMQASRVKNSNMFALESKDAYDPASTPTVERPTANRPLSEQISNNSFARLDSVNRDSRADQGSQLKCPSKIPLPPSPEKQGSRSPSPTKSSLARVSQFDMTKSEPFGTQTTLLELSHRIQKPRTLRRHAKSVTFHEDPPEVNEYEQPTPEPSLSAASDREGSWDSDDFYDPEYSFERGSSLDRDRHIDDSFDADLENADKTPVVLPEDWSRMSPEEARTDLADGNDDVFDTSNEPTQTLNLGRPDSRISSDSESRPLPPLPGLRSPKPIHSVEASRDPPSPLKRASCSKDDILRITSSSPLSAHERLSLLISPKKSTSIAEERSNAPDTSTITNLDTGEKTDLEVLEKEDVTMMDELPDLASPPRISRESILRKVRNTKYDFEDEDDSGSEYDNESIDASAGRPTLAELARMDPDEAVPSRETSHEKSDIGLTYESRLDFDHLDGVGIKLEPLDDVSFDLSVIPDIHERATRSPSRLEDYDRQSSVLRHPVEYDEADEEESEYMNSILPDGESTPTNMRSPVPEDNGKETLNDAMQLLTVHDYCEAPYMAPQHAVVELAMPVRDSFSSGLPTYLSTDDFGSGFEKFITPSPPSTANSEANAAMAPPSFQAGFAAKEAEVFAASIPKISPPTSPFLTGYDNLRGEYSEVSGLQEHESHPPCVQEIPERKATIRTNGRLKTRPSGSAADFLPLANMRQLDEAEYPVPAIPQAFSAEVECEESERSCYSSSSSTESKADSLVDDTHTKRDSTTMLDLDIASHDDNGLDLGAAFDKVIEAQKKGYVMRENDKVVVATNRNVSGDSQSTAHSSDSAATISDNKPLPGRPNSSSDRRKPSGGEQYLKTEPWNGTTRRKSVRNSSSLKPAPHNQHSGVGHKPLGIVDEDYAAGSAKLDDEIADDVERGRLFVKVVGVRDLELPLPRNDCIFFQLTLDNGLHCVTTADLELKKNASIGQEFELVVLNDLEFQLTLTTKLPPPPSKPTTSIPSPVKSNRAPKAGFSRFLSSPKKRAEKERQEREAAEAEERRQQEELRRKRAALKPTAWDLLHELVNEADGSFARAYVNLKDHEKECFGRQLTVRVPCYNEWALEKDAAVMTSVRSKRGNKTGPIRRPPYIVGYVELQLLYIPKPKGATDEDMPKSMNGAVREMNKASEVKFVTHDGYLSQQGGDCKHWRRRFFRLQGVRLTAYHEHTNQKRAVINLSKASRLVDDRSMLVADPTSGNPKNRNRRKSAFAEEDEGYQYVEEGFRLRFANGETIDFYADSRAQKDEWMQAMGQVIGKPDSGKKGTTWTDLVLAREQAEGASDARKPAELASLTFDERTSTDHAELPGSEVYDVINKSVAAAAATTTSRKQSDREPVAALNESRNEPREISRPPNARARTPPLTARTDVRSRAAVKSMIF